MLNVSAGCSVDAKPEAYCGRTFSQPTTILCMWLSVSACVPHSKVINAIYLSVIGFEKADNVALLSFFLGIISLGTNAFFAVSDIRKVSPLRRHS